MPADVDLWAALSFYALTPAAVRQIEPVGGGWSGSRLWRVTDIAGRQLCLRQWPTAHPTPERLQFIHEVLLQVFDRLPIVAAPLKTARGTTFVEQGGHLWELSEWRLGKADDSAQPSRARLRAAMHVLARFHELTRPQIECRQRPQAWVDRGREFSYHRHRGVEAIERSLGLPLGNEIDSRSERLLSVARRALDAPFWQACSSPPQLPVQIVIRDIHREHVLFTGDEVTGLIDFGAMRKLDTPLTDVARLMGSLAGDVCESRKLALQAYAEIRHLTDSDCKFVDFLDASNVVLAALNWLTWLYVERRDMGEIGPIVRRLDCIAGRLALLP